jgi:hypothetical protein
MKNAHERFGKLVYRRRTEKTATNLRVFLDTFVGEDRGKAHLVSVVGGDVEIGALAAAFANGDSFTAVDPYGEESIVSLGEELEPTAMHSVHPVMGKNKGAEPDEQNRIVETNTPEKNVLEINRRHNAPAAREFGPSTPGCISSSIPICSSRCAA